MKKLSIFAAVAVVALTLTASTASAKPGNGTPFQELWDEIDEVRTEVAAISGVIEDPDAWIESFFDVFMQIEDHEDDVDALQAQIDDLRDELEELQTTCSDCCSPACEPEDEVCDGEDNDCDGEVDEEFPEDGDSCSTGLYGVCSTGVMMCSEGGLICEPLNSPLAEVCNGIDDDCDGVIDDGLDCGCVDLDDPATYGSVITFEPTYGTYYVKGDVTLCTDTYDMTGKNIQILSPHDSHTLDCNGSTLVGGGAVPGTSAAIFIACLQSNPGWMCSTNATVENCTIQDFNVGVSSRTTSDTTVRNNVFRNLNYGVSLSGVHHSRVSGNTFEDMNYEAVSLKLSPVIPYQRSEWNEIDGNDISGSGHYGINLYTTLHNTITGNRIVDSTYHGLRIYEGGDNTIYDNYFDNLSNAWAYSPSGWTNAWNVTPVAGTNILGGGMIGGNYWSDYSGTDATGDGIGDTDLPYTSGGNIQGGDGDSAPLVM